MMVDNNTNLLEAFRTNVEQRRLEEPKALSSGIKKPTVSKKRKAKNAMIKIYVNGALLLISAALVFVAYRLAVLPEIFPTEVSATKDSTNHPVNSNANDFQGAANFANNFAFNWLSGNLGLASKYAAIGYQFPQNVLSTQKQEVQWNQVWNVNPKSEKTVTVVIQAQVKYASLPKPKVVYLSVPVTIQGGKYGVTDVPTYIPAPGKATFTQVQNKELSISETDGNTINNIINLFLSEYFGGDGRKTGTYFSNGVNRSVILGGKLSGIQQVNLYQVQENNQNKALAEVIANVTIDNISMLQKFKFNMVKTNNRWYIESTDPVLPNYIPPKNDNQTNGGVE